MPIHFVAIEALLIVEGFLGCGHIAAKTRTLRAFVAVNKGRHVGSQLMTPQERNDNRARMNAARTGQERDQIRQANHEQMKERAKQQGVTLLDEPPAYGMAQSMGSGSGIGPSSRRMK